MQTGVLIRKEDEDIDRHREVARERRKRGSKRKRKQEKRNKKASLTQKLSDLQTTKRFPLFFSNFTFRNFYRCYCPLNFKMMC